MASVGAGGLISVTWLALRLDILNSSGFEGILTMNTEIFALLGCLAAICRQYVTRRTAEARFSPSPRFTYIP